MKCPNCNETLLITERHQVEIDYCPNCRGVWLDRGELDKLLEYAEANRHKPDSQYQDNKVYKNQKDSYGDQHKYKGGYDNYGNHRERKKKSFLSELFDFD